MHIAANITETIGNTPLIRLKAASELTKCEILGKAEFLNPGQSIKDRAALGIIRAAEARGQLKPGGLIIEGTAGNTGIGIAMVANALGYKSMIVMPRNQAREKKDAIRMFGAKLIEVDAAPYSSPNHYIRYSARLARENNAFWANQFDNTDNRDIHRKTTGAEIWNQANGQIDAFICSVGTGGTLAGIGIALKERDANIKIALADPEGAALFSYYNSGELKSSGSSIMEGIGQSRITGNLEGISVDHAYCIPDHEALRILFDLTTKEGMCLGGSSGINIAGAIRLGKELGPGHRIITVLCDYGHRYQSKLYDPAFLGSRNLPIPPWTN